MTDPNPIDRLAAGYDTPAPDGDARLRFRASAYRPDHDAEADRMRALAERLTTSQRLALGYHDSARDAAAALTRKDHHQ